MKRYKQLIDIILLLSMGAITFVAVAPETVVMPTSLQMILLGVALVSLASFMALLWREDPADEREMQNQAFASRAAYLIGSLVLIVALVIQSFNHEIDPAVSIALLAMIATKILVQRTRDK